MRWILTLCILALGAAASAGYADVYRSVDPDGRVHYTDRWVPGSELIRVDKHHPADEASAARIEAERAKLAASNDKIAADQNQVATERAVKQDVEKARATQCKEAKDNYQKAIVARRVFRTTPDGKREYLSEAEADQHRIKAREEMDLVCGTQAR